MILDMSDFPFTLVWVPSFFVAGSHLFYSFLYCKVLPRTSSPGG